MAKIEPNALTIGESYDWARRVSDYPSDGGWSLVYSFAGPEPFTVTAQPDEDDSEVYRASITDQTAGKPAGLYYWQATMLNGDERRIIGRGQLRLLPDLTDAAAGYDGRSLARKTLDAIDAVLLKRATTDQQSYVIGNRQLSRIPINELLVLRDKYAALVAREVGMERRRRGRPFRNIFVRF